MQSSAKLLSRRSRVGLWFRKGSRWSNENPWKCSMITGLSILGTADIATQWLTWRLRNDPSHPATQPFNWDTRRSVAVATFGALYFGLVCRRAFIFYDSVAARIQRSRQMKGLTPLSESSLILAKTIVDCWIHTPFAIVPSFYVMTGLIKGMSMNEIRDQMREQLMMASLSSAVYWSPIMAFQFAFIPAPYRTAYISSVSFLQKMALSWVSNQDRVQNRENDEQGQILQISQEQSDQSLISLDESSLTTELSMHLSHSMDVPLHVSMPLNLTETSSKKELTVSTKNKLFSQICENAMIELEPMFS